MLAREGLVGIDFDIVGGARPTNWAQYIGGPSPVSLLNLGDEAGQSTEIDFAMTGGAFGFSTAALAIPAAQVPQHTPALAALGGYISTAASSLSMTWSGLSSEASYLVYVFGLSNAAASTNVTIQGATTESFQQALSGSQLAVNGEFGSNLRTLASYGIVMSPNAMGQIQLTLSEVSGNIPLAGVALEAFDPDDELFEALSPGISAWPISGNLDAFDVDLLRLPATAGERLLIDLDTPSGSGLDSLLTLFDADGVEIAFSDDDPAPGESASTLESYLDFTFPTSDVYYLGVSGFGNRNYDPLTGSGDQEGSVGAYQIFIDSLDPDDQFAEASTLFLSTDLSADLETGRDVDMYQFNLTLGQRVAIDIDSVEGVAGDAMLRLFHAAGTQLAFSDDNTGPGENPFGTDPFLDFIAPATGLYYLGVSSFPNSSYDVFTGVADAVGVAQPYRLLVTIVDPSDPDDQLIEAAAVAPNSMVSGNISTGSDVDMLRFDVTAGQRLTFDLDRPDGVLDSVLRLFDNAGNVLATSDDDPGPGEFFSTESFLGHTFDVSATYYLGISGYSNFSYDPHSGTGDGSGNSTGDYKLTITLVDPSDPDDQFVEAVSTSVGTASLGTLDNFSDVDMYILTVTAGQTVSFDIDRPSVGPFVDSMLRLFDSSGAELAFNDDGAAPNEPFTTESYLSHTIAIAGNYFLGVAVYNNRNYDPLTGVDSQPGTSTGDYTLVIRWECGLVGDANGDGSVGAADYAIWAAQFGQSGPGLSADFDGNGSVGAGDYALWAANFGKSCALLMSASAPAAAPLASVATMIPASPSPPSSATASPTTVSSTNPTRADGPRDSLAPRPARNHRAALERVFADLARSRHGGI